MKKQIMALAMLLATTPVMAEEQSTTTITATVESTYTLTIPTTTQISYGATNSTLAGSLKVTGNIAANKKVRITATCNPMTCPTQSTIIPFTLKNGNASFTEATWTATELQSTTPKALSLSVSVSDADWRAAKAGEYTGSIVFTASLTD